MLFDGAVRPHHVFAFLLRQLGWRRLDVGNMEGICEAFYNLCQENPVFMKSFACAGGHCVNVASMVQQFEMSGCLLKTGCDGVYLIGQISLLAKLSPDANAFADFHGCDILRRFSLPPVPPKKYIEI